MNQFDDLSIAGYFAKKEQPKPEPKPESPDYRKELQKYKYRIIRRLLRLRGKKRLTHREIATITGYSQPHISRIATRELANKCK